MLEALLFVPALQMALAVVLVLLIGADAVGIASTVKRALLVWLLLFAGLVAYEAVAAPRPLQVSVVGFYAISVTVGMAPTVAALRESRRLGWRPAYRALLGVAVGLIGVVSAPVVAFVIGCGTWDCI